MSQHLTDADVLNALRAGLESPPTPSPELAAFLAGPSTSSVVPTTAVVGDRRATALRRVPAASRWAMAVAAILVLLVGAGAGHVLPGPVQDAFDTVVRVVLPDRDSEPGIPAPSDGPPPRPAPSTQVPEQDSVPTDRRTRSDATGSAPRGDRDDGRGDDGGEDDARDREEDLAEQQQERREDQRDRREEQRDRAEDAAEEQADEAADAAEDAQDAAEDEAEDARDRREDRDEEREERERERRD
jgi:type IV secretory pathway VirB10-like protein